MGATCVFAQRKAYLVAHGIPKEIADVGSVAQPQHKNRLPIARLVFFIVFLLSPVVILLCLRKTRNAQKDNKILQ
jgi:hypothetical protein